MSTLKTFLSSVTIEPSPVGRWAALGPQAGTAAKILLPDCRLLPFSNEVLPLLDGLLLAGACSTRPPAETDEWLRTLTRSLKPGATLLVIDWRTDGLLTTGPPLEHRFKLALLRKHLRMAGFGQMELLLHHGSFYALQAKNVPPVKAAPEFVPVAGKDELSKNEMKLVHIGDEPVVVANTGREIVAFAATCPHAGGRLELGLLRGRTVACPVHHFLWNVHTGDPLQPEDEDILRRYSVQVDPDGGQVRVALRPPVDE